MNGEAGEVYFRLATGRWGVCEPDGGLREYDTQDLAKADAVGWQHGVLAAVEWGQSRDRTDADYADPSTWPRDQMDAVNLHGICGFGQDRRVVGALVAYHAGFAAAVAATIAEAIR